MSVGKGLARHGHVSYLEIPVLEMEKSAKFYENIFGWDVQRRSATNVAFDDLSGDLIGRFVAGRTPSTDPGIMPYVYVDSVETVARAIAHAGGEIVKAPHPEGNLTVATFRDPAGNVLGIWEAA